MERHEELVVWLRDLLTRRGKMLPIELRLSAENAEYDWTFWQDTPVVQDVIELAPREAFPGFTLPHYVLKKGADQ